MKRRPTQRPKQAMVETKRLGEAWDRGKPHHSCTGVLAVTESFSQADFESVGGSGEIEILAKVNVLQSPKLVNDPPVHDTGP